MAAFALLTSAGAAVLELRRLGRKGGPEEVKALKKRERELRALLEATEEELQRAKTHSAAAEDKASQLQAKAESLEQAAAELGQQKEQLQQNNSKLVITNLLLLNKTKSLEEHTRALVAKHEDLQHQLAQLQRDQAAAEASLQSSLAALKEQVTAVLNRYFSRDISLQQALAEMGGMGIDVVCMDELASRQGADATTMDFETKLVLDSPHRMQRLMCAGSSIKVPQLTAGEAGSDVPMLSFPLGISKDPSTGVARVTLGWREPQFAPPSRGTSLGGLPDAPQQLQDQVAAAAAGSSSKQPALLQDTSSPDKAGKAQAAKAAAAKAASDGQALTFSSPQKAKPEKKGAGFSISFGSLGRFGAGSSSSGGAGSASSSGGAAKALALGSDLLKGLDDDLPAFTAGDNLALSTRP